MCFCVDDFVCGKWAKILVQVVKDHVGFIQVGSVHVPKIFARFGAGVL